MKHWIKIVLCVLAALVVLSPFCLYIGITVANDGIANAVKNELKTYPLPEGTVLEDSLSAAGKLVGNGNGMQYMGAILIAGDVHRQDILEHYRKEFDYIEVYRQTSPTISSVRPSSCRFDRFDSERDDPYYSVICWGSKHDYVNDSFSWLLDFDLRGH